MVCKCNELSEDVFRLLEALEAVKIVLESDNPAIVDTLWVPSHISLSATLYDYVCVAIQDFNSALTPE